MSNLVKQQLYCLNDRTGNRVEPNDSINNRIQIMIIPNVLQLMVGKLHKACYNILHNGMVGE